MKRFAIVLVAVLIGAAAPARAWCEANCLAPAHHAEESAKPHCPTHESSSGEAALSAATNADCPIVESARPIPSKIDLARVTSVTDWQPAPRHLSAPALRHAGTQALRHLANIPLRI